MTTRLLAVCLVGVAVIAVVSTARADDVPPPSPSPSPSETSSGRSLAGSIQLDYLAVPTDAHARATTLDGATVELSLKLTKDFSKDASATVKMCFACHGFEVGMAYIELRAADELRVRVGRMTPAFGSFPLRHDPSNHQTSDKPLPYDMGRMIRRLEWNEGILPAPWVDNGIEISGTHFWSGGQLDYAAYGMSGPKAGPDAADFDFILSRTPSQYYVDNNSQPIVGARVSAAFDLDDTNVLTVGASGMAGHYDPDRQLGFAIGGVDAVLQIAGMFVRAEYLIRATQMALGDNPATRFKYGPGANGRFDDYFVKEGFYAEGEVPVGKLSLIGRWDGLRRIGNVLVTDTLSSHASVLRYTGALAYKLQSGIRLKTSLEYYQFSDYPNDVAIHLGVAAPF